MKKRFTKYRKRQLLLCIALLFTCFALSAQQPGNASYPTQHSNWDEVDDLTGYKVQMEAVDETCPNNGAVRFRIVNSQGNPVNDEEFASLNLQTSPFRISHRGMTLDHTMNHYDTSYNVNAVDGWQYVPMEHGRFEVTMQCIHVEPGSGQRISVLYSDTLEIVKRYEDPKFFVITRPSYDGIEPGIIKSLECMNTGRVQLCITGGAFPVYIHATNDEGTVDTVYQFDGRQYSGNDSSRYDYKDYYTIENLPPGTYHFEYDNVCPQHIPAFTAKVETISIPKLAQKIQVHAYSGNKYDHNVIKIKTDINCEYEYYIRMFASRMYYKFEVPAQGHTPALQTDYPWTQFPANDRKSVTLRDTVEAARSYCDLMNRQIKFRFKVDTLGSCPAWDTVRTFYLQKPDSFYQSNTWIQDSTSTVSDLCAARTIYEHTDNFEIRYYRFDSNYVWTLPDMGVEGRVYRYHITYPLVWSYFVHVAGGDEEIKTDTIWSNFETEHGVISYAELSAFYEQGGQSVPNKVPLRRTLTDAHGCQLYDKTDSIIVERREKNAAGPQWQISVTENTRCCTPNSSKRSIQLKELYGSDNLDYDGLTIELFESPDDNLYNFTGVYNSTSRQWTYSGVHIHNQADLEGSANGRSFKFSLRCMPSGYYKFRVSNTPCGNDTTLWAYLPGISSIGMAEDFQYEVIEHCTDDIIKITHGAVATYNRYVKTNNNHSNAVVKVDTTRLPTLFKIIDGPAGGYDPRGKTYRVGDSIVISFPTTPDKPYKIRIYPDPQGQTICEDYSDTVEFFYEGKILGFDFATALLCDHNDTAGIAYVKALRGMPPYTYTLYSRPDMNGDILGQATLNSQDSVAIFGTPDDKIPFSASSFLSCKVEDACGWSYVLNFTPQVLADLQLAWFSPDIKHTCEGDSVTIYALQYGMIFDYTWRDPMGNIFYDGPNATVFIPRGADTGVYTITIHQAGCQQDFESSVEIKPEKSPHVHLEFTGNTPVCPGGDAPFSFLAHTSQYDPEHPDVVRPGTVNFTVAIEDMFGITYRHYSAGNDQTVYDTIHPNTPTKVYPVQISETVGECTYNRADLDDTIYIEINPERIDPCSIMTRNDIVCRGDTALLQARCTEDVPFYLRWYYDYELTDLVRCDTILNNTLWDTLVLPKLMEHTARYVSVAKDDKCPSVNNAPTSTLNMTTDKDTVVLQCSDELMFYDEGGKDGDYAGNSSHTFSTSEVFISEQPGHPIVIYFDSLNLSPTSYISIFNGEWPLRDSLIATIDCTTETPLLISTDIDTMLVYFTPGETGGEGWRALVKPSPGIAVADVVLPSVAFYQDWACQSETNPYTNRRILDLGIVDSTTLANDLRKAKTYEYATNRLVSASGCDSTALLTFVVNPAPKTETFAVTTSQFGFKWHKQDGSDSIYYQPGAHVINYPDPETGCDRLEILNLIVIEVTNSDDSVCYGDSVVIGVTVVTHDTVKPKSQYVDQRHAIGDVLCMIVDGNHRETEILRPEEYVHYADSMWRRGYDYEDLPMKPYGVIVYLDPTNNLKGKAISLVDTRSERRTLWSPTTYMTDVHSTVQCGTTSSWINAHWEMTGKQNTLDIVSSALAAYPDHPEEAAPAAYSCYIYNPLEPGQPTGWYLPSCGEWMFCYAYRYIINNTLKQLGPYGATMLQGNGDDNYWTSTEVNDSNAACVNGKGQIILHHGKNGTSKGKLNNYAYRVRAMYIFGEVDQNNQDNQGNTGE